MKCQDLFQSDQPLDFAKRFAPALWCSDVVTRREQMSGIETNSQALGSFDLVINRRQMLHLVAQTAPLPRGVLEGNPHRKSFGRRKGFVKSADDLLETCRLACAQVCARMHDKKWKTEVGGKLNFLNQGFDRALAVVGCR